MGQIGAIIADAGSLSVRYAKRLLEGIPDNRFGRLSAPGGTPIQANHPAFTLGHLSLYPHRVFELLQRDGSAVKPPSGYQAMFSKDAKCIDDIDGKLYPAKSALVEFTIKAYESALEAMREADDKRLLAENPLDNPMKKICPTIGAILGFYLTGHAMSHLGQLSTWRRMEGLPPA